MSRGEAQREADAVMVRFRWMIPRERDDDGGEEFDTADLRERAVLEGVDVERRIEVDDARETRSCISRAFAGRADTERTAVCNPADFYKWTATSTNPSNNTDYPPPI